jgi:FkbM family methyltransferase
VTDRPERLLLSRFLYRGLRARYRDERAEIASLTAAIRQGQTAVDVGAHKGSYLLWLSRAADPGKVVAFEPQPVLADYLRRACRATGLENVVVEAAGVSERSGSRALHVPGTRASSPGATFEPGVAAASEGRDLAVPVVSLDEYFRDWKERIAAIKIDVEGHELAVLRGAEELLRRHGPLLVVECEERHRGQGGVREVLRHLEERGYGGSFVRRSRLFPIRDFDPAIHQRRAGERFWDASDYCNNFVLSRSGARPPALR